MKEIFEIQAQDFFYTEEQRLLFTLRKILNYELLTVSFYLIYFISAIVLYASIIAAIVFTPFLIYVLIRTKKISWLVSFSAITLLPILIILIVNASSMYTYTFLLFQLGIFYLYCFVLRFSVNDWTQEISSQHALNKQREDAKKNLEIFQSRYDHTVD